ncbi:MAG: chemotaxis protein CheC [Thermoleophilales bacterium]|nr:chemotaxis protein CheC [Thermoleophilales bacterium]
MTTYTDLQIDALRELANIGSGTAATALSGMLGRPVDISVPNPLLLSLNDAVDAVGPSDAEVTGVVIGIAGDMDATVLMLFTPETAAVLCPMLGVEPGTEIGLSALQEIGNIMGASYTGALATMTGLELEPVPPQAATDMLGSIVSSVLLAPGEDRDAVLLLDSALTVEGGDECRPSFMFIPSHGGVTELLKRLGLA